MTIDGSGLDRVLADAVAGGSAPHVAAIAADEGRDPLRGRRGRAGRRRERRTRRHRTQFRIMSMTKMVGTTTALQQVERGDLDLDAPVEDVLPGVRRGAGARRAGTGTRRGCGRPATKATVQPAHHPHLRPGLLVLERRPGAVRGRDRSAERRPGQAEAFEAPMVADPGTATSTASTPTGSARSSRPSPARRLDVVVKEDITGPLGMGDTMFGLDAGRRRTA